MVHVFKKSGSLCVLHVSYIVHCMSKFGASCGFISIVKYALFGGQIKKCSNCFIYTD